MAVDVWGAPELPEEVLPEDRPQTQARVSIEDHPNLQAPHLRELFEAFRKEVQALDPCISEEILKSCIRYKAEATFVSVYPQAKLLHLPLNMNFADITDPRGICRNVSGMRRAWSNAEVEVKLGKIEDLPYVIGLVRQSLEQQLGGENEE